MIEKRQWTSAKRRKDSHSYRGIPKNPEITVAQNAGEFKKKEEIVLRRRNKGWGEYYDAWTERPEGDEAIE